MGIAAALNDVVNAFRGVSVSVDGADAYPLRATSDPADIQTPTVWVPMPDVAFQFNKNRAVVTWVAYLMAPSSPKQRTQTAHLAAMVDAVTGLYPFTTGELFRLDLQGGTSAVAYKLTWESHTAIGA